MYTALINQTFNFQVLLKAIKTPLFNFKTAHELSSGALIYPCMNTLLISDSQTIVQAPQIFNKFDLF